MIKPIIENFSKCESCSLDDNCNGILIWKENIFGNDRIHLYLQEENYVIVLEKRTNYYLLITAFYVDYDKEEYFINKYDQYKISIEDI